MESRSSSVLGAAILVVALALSGCAEQPQTAPSDAAASQAATVTLDSAVTSSPEAVVTRFLEASNAGDGDTMNALYGPEMMLFANSEPVSPAISDWSIEAVTDTDRLPENAAAGGASEPSTLPQRIVTVPVRLEVAGSSAYFPLEQGAAMLRFTLVTDDGDSWRIHSLRTEQ